VWQASASPMMVILKIKNLLGVLYKRTVKFDFWEFSSAAPWQTSASPMMIILTIKFLRNVLYTNNYSVGFSEFSSEAPWQTSTSPLMIILKTKLLQSVLYTKRLQCWLVRHFSSSSVADVSISSDDNSQNQTPSKNTLQNECALVF